MFVQHKSEPTIQHTIYCNNFLAPWNIFEQIINFWKTKFVNHSSNTDPNLTQYYWTDMYMYDHNTGSGQVISRDWAIQWTWLMYNFSQYTHNNICIWLWNNSWRKKAMGELEHVTKLIIRASHNSLNWLVNCTSKSKFGPTLKCLKFWYDLIYLQWYI